MVELLLDENFGGEIMPDDHGRLTPDDHRKILNWWTRHWKPPVECPVCKTATWSTADYVVTLHRHAADAYVGGGPAFQMIMTTCNTCAHTMLFNAVSMGVVAEYNILLDDSQNAQTLLNPPKEG